MGRKIIFVSIGIIITIFFIISFNFGLFKTNFPNINTQQIKMPSLNLQNGSIFNNEALKEPKPLIISIKSLTNQPINSNSTTLQIIFNVFNPNKSTVLMELIAYNIFSDLKRIISGDIGEIPEGFVDSQANIFPIVGNGTLTVKDKKILTNNGDLQEIWANILDNQTKYVINGTLSYKQTSSFQASGAENQFSITFP